MLKRIQKFLVSAIFVIGILYLLMQGFYYSRSLDKMPTGMTVAGVDVSGLTPEEATEHLQQQYLTNPVQIHHRDEIFDLDPATAGFVLDIDNMLIEAQAAREQNDVWLGFAEYLVGRSLQPIQIDLYATHDRQVLVNQMQTIISFLDKPATAPHINEQTQTFTMGQPGYITNLEPSFSDIEDALYRLEDREVTLIVEDQEAIPFNMQMLKNSIEEDIFAFDGLGSIFILDLSTGEELSINADIAVSGLSIVKIAIMLETYRALDFEPNSDQAKLLSETAVQSGNFSANLLLDIVAGQDNAYLGVDILTESMHNLGLINTFIVTPYEEPNRAGHATLATPANLRTDITVSPDPTMQTTAEDVGTLLSMIYHCTQGGGALLTLYSDQLTPQECQAIIDIMSRNDEAQLIRVGLPEGVQLAHKHGWAGNTHGDAGIVFSQSGDYIIVEYLIQPHTDWLVHATSFPILREISRTTYNYFNFSDPFFGNEPEIESSSESEDVSPDVLPDEGSDKDENVPTIEA